MVTSWSCRGPHTFPKDVPERGDGPGGGVDRAGLTSAWCQGGGSLRGPGRRGGGTARGTAGMELRRNSGLGLSWDPHGARDQVKKGWATGTGPQCSGMGTSPRQ